MLDNPAALVQMNRRFHDIIVECAHNQFLGRAIAVVYALITLLGDSSLLDGPHAREAHAQHRAFSMRSSAVMPRAPKRWRANMCGIH